MEVRQRGETIIVSHKLKKNETYKINNTGKFNTISIFRKPQLVKGYSNSCEDGKGILLIDYDNCSERVILDDYKLIQRLFKLPPSYLFKTKENNFHVVCLKKFYHPHIFNILSHVRCDSNYSTMPLRNPYKNYVLRLGPKKGSKKPKFIKIIGEDKYLNEEISSAHLNLLKSLFNLPAIPYKNKDGLTKFFLQEYECRG